MKYLIFIIVACLIAGCCTPEVEIISRNSIPCNAYIENDVLSLYEGKNPRDLGHEFKKSIKLSYNSQDTLMGNLNVLLFRSDEASMIGSSGCSYEISISNRLEMEVTESLIIKFSAGKGGEHLAIIDSITPSGSLFDRKYKYIKPEGEEILPITIQGKNYIGVRRFVTTDSVYTVYTNVAYGFLKAEWKGNALELLP